MLLLSSTTSAMLGMLLALSSINNSCALRHTLEDTRLGRESRGLRGPKDDSASLPSCGSRARTDEEVKAFSEMIQQFYQEAQSSPGGSRRLQEAITINVNFVNVRSTAGLGATEAQVQAQIDALNTAYRPDFVFNLSTTQVVTNDNYFGNIDPRATNGPVEAQLKAEYRRGGMDTLNVYSANIMTNGSTTGGWAITANGSSVNDGVTMDYTTVPTGGHHIYTKGFVRIECSHP
jgi:hypothetical protein